VISAALPGTEASYPKVPHSASFRRHGPAGCTGHLCVASDVFDPDSQANKPGDHHRGVVAPEQSAEHAPALCQGGVTSALLVRLLDEGASRVPWTGPVGTSSSADRESQSGGAEPVTD